MSTQEMTHPEMLLAMTPQERFDHLYITSNEICEDLGIERSTVMNAKNRGLLPDPIVINSKFHIWERATATPFINAWRINLKARRGELR